MSMATLRLVALVGSLPFLGNGIMAQAVTSHDADSS